MSPCLYSPFFNSNRNKEQFSKVVTDTCTGKGSASVYIMANHFHVTRVLVVVLPTLKHTCETPWPGEW